MYEVSYIKQINNQNIENSKDFYLEKMKQSIVNKDYIKEHIFFVKKNQNLGLILKKIKLSTPYPILKKKKSNCFYNIYVNDKITIKTKDGKLHSIERKNKSINCIYKTEDNSIKKVNRKFRPQIKM